MKNRLFDIYLQHEQLRSKSINLLPSENTMSPLAKMFYSGDMGNRYYFQDPFSENQIEYSYTGTEYIAEIIGIGQGLAKKIFHSEHASLYPPSGHMANLTIMLRYCERGDLIMVYDPAYGGYPGLANNKLPKQLGLRVEYLPVCRYMPEMLDIDQTVTSILSFKPKLIFLSLAHTLFPVELGRMKDASREVGAKIIYDGSHPLGLIAGHQFQDPIAEGVDFLVGGTQKSFPGPQGGIILSNSGDLDTFEHFVTVDNPHFNRIAATVVTLAEMYDFGELYARKVIENTKYFAECLHKRGFDILYPEKGFTDSHMFKFSVDSRYHDLVDKLKNSGIFLDYSGRVGCGEITREGCSKEALSELADLFVLVIENRNVQDIYDKVRDLRSSFSGTDYCFEVS